MKRVAIALILLLLLVGCYKHISKVEHKWGPPAKVEDRGDTIVYFYYFYKATGSAIIPTGKRGAMVLASGTEGIVVVEIITDRSGNILDKRKYWKQPTQQ
jgi:hypothetical protein